MFSPGNKIAMMGQDGSKYIGIVKMCTVSQSTYGDLQYKGDNLNSVMRLVINDLVLVKDWDDFSREGLPAPGPIAIPEVD